MVALGNPVLCPLLDRLIQRTVASIPPDPRAAPTPVRLPADGCSRRHWCSLSVCVAGACDLCQWQPFRPSHSSRRTDSLPWPRQQFLCVPWSRSWGCGLWAETHHGQGLPHHCRGTGRSWRMLSSVLCLVSWVSVKCEELLVKN